MVVNIDLNEALQHAVSWARKAGEIQLSHYRRRDLEMDTKSNVYDVVTIADKESEQYILSQIAALYPEHNVLSEESGDSERDSDWRWVIDPLDGTTNYSQGLPVFSISIALQYKEETQLGVVYAPYLDELFTAIKGNGAFMNGKPIHCGAKTELAKCVLATGMPYDRKENPDNNLREIGEMSVQVRGIRRYGSAAMDLCYVAAGYFDGYWEPALHLWDVAAGMLIAAEAGARTGFYRPDRGHSALAANPSIYQILFTRLTPSDL